MHTEPQNEQKTTQQSRRQFLTRTTAGVVIASLPAKSVWATTGGIAQSIVASGHGSDFAGGVRMKVLSLGYFKNHNVAGCHSWSFETIFGGKPFKKNSSVSAQDNNFLTILQGTGSDAAGASNVNAHMIAIYMAAYMHVNNLGGVYYPVIGPNKFANLDAFAKHLYAKAKLDPSGVGVELGNIIGCFDTNSATACAALGVSQA